MDCRGPQNPKTPDRMLYNNLNTKWWNEKGYSDWTPQISFGLKARSVTLSTQAGWTSSASMTSLIKICRTSSMWSYAIFVKDWPINQYRTSSANNCYAAFVSKTPSNLTKSAPWTIVQGNLKRQKKYRKYTNNFSTLLLSSVLGKNAKWLPWR